MSAENEKRSIGSDTAVIDERDVDAAAQLAPTGQEDLSPEEAARIR